jgi:carotenoid cleavage dioxygenase-like enzyme
MSQALESPLPGSNEIDGRAAWWLQGNFAPVRDEIEAFDLKVEGALPPELNGVYMRNGANPKNGNSAHWFFGSGMLHGVRLEKGKAAWYRNRYVRTPNFLQPRQETDAAAIMDRARSSANTHIVRHAGRFLALEEAHFPFEVTGDLETVGPCDFGGKLKTAFTAHPKFCPETGEMFAFGYGFVPPYLTYYRFDREGRLVQSTEIPVGGPTMIHDFCVTRRHAIFMDLPIVFDMTLAAQGVMPYRWSDAYPARLGVMPRGGSAAELKWLDIKPCYVFHSMNAYDEGNMIVFDVARYGRLWSRGEGGKDTRPRLYRWTLDLDSGRVGEQALDEQPIEFPRVADGVAGLKYRYGYAPMTSGENDGSSTHGGRLLKFDLQTGTRESYDFEDCTRAGEFVLASANGNEDAGWLMGYVHEDRGDRSSFVVLDGADVSAGPVARIVLPQRVPYGFHGNWFAD